MAEVHEAHSADVVRLYRELRSSAALELGDALTGELPQQLHLWRCALVALKNAN